MLCYAARKDQAPGLAAGGSSQFVQDLSKEEIDAHNFVFFWATAGVARPQSRRSTRPSTVILAQSTAVAKIV
jgi:hypothetical protein